MLTFSGRPKVGFWIALAALAATLAVLALTYIDAIAGPPVPSFRGHVVIFLIFFVVIFTALVVVWAVAALLWERFQKKPRENI
jgi:uncharacterized membrane protein YhaH (DUF805 family)